MHGDSIHARALHRESEGHSPEGVWYIVSRESPDAPPPRSQLTRIAPKGLKSVTPYSQSSQVHLSAQPTPLRESLGRFKQCDSKTSQASYGHTPGVTSISFASSAFLFLFWFSFGRLFLVPRPRGHKPTAASPLHILCCTKPEGLVQRYSSPPWCRSPDDPPPRSPSIISHSPPAHVVPRSPALSLPT